MTNYYRTRAAYIFASKKRAQSSKRRCRPMMLSLPGRPFRLDQNAAPHRPTSAVAAFQSRCSRALDLPNLKFSCFLAKRDSGQLECLFGLCMRGALREPPSTQYCSLLGAVSRPVARWRIGHCKVVPTTAGWLTKTATTMAHEW